MSFSSAAPPDYLYFPVSGVLQSPTCSILVLGTEEFMYPALLAAREMEKLGHYVRFHATTRSPILPGSEESYPLHRRYELKSPYDAERATYV